MIEASGILGPEGPLARSLGTRFEHRVEQGALADAVAHAMATRSHLLAEAGTGVGKSFAYLVPAILRCVEHGERVVVATNTIALQEQLVEKDIPALRSALEHAGVIPTESAGPGEGHRHPLRPVLVKGRGNYVSIRRLRLASQRQATLFTARGALLQLHRIEDWAYATTDGTRATLPRLTHPEVWTHVESDADNCMGARCPHNAQCFYQNARRAMEKGNLLICNHALFFADLALRTREDAEGRTGAGFLPRYDHVVLDEAHAVEDTAAEHLGMSLSEGRVQFLLRTLIDARRRKGYLVQLSSLPLASGAEGVDRAIRLALEAGDAADRFFGAWGDLLASGRLRQGRVREPGMVSDTLSPAFRELSLRLSALRDSVRNEADRFELGAYARRAADIAHSASEFVAQALPGCVYWIESGRSGRARRVTLAAAPVDVAPILGRVLFGREWSTVLTSATLATAGSSSPTAAARSERVVVPEDAAAAGDAPRPADASSGAFGLVMSRLGCVGARTLLLGSPFDYARQMEVFVDRAAPDPGDRGPGFYDALADCVLRHVAATTGGAFVLFNSFAALREVAARLADPLAERGLPLLIHEPESPRGDLLTRFRQDDRSVLLGAASFWQGVDVPGRGLRNVVIAQLPFEPPDRPLTEARLELVAGRGGDPFRDESLPRAVLRFKQGVGRLIRSAADTGRVVILDPRVVTKGYGRAFLRALPAGARVRIEGPET